MSNGQILKSPHVKLGMMVDRVVIQQLILNHRQKLRDLYFV